MSTFMRAAGGGGHGASRLCHSTRLCAADWFACGASADPVHAPRQSNM